MKNKLEQVKKRLLELNMSIDIGINCPVCGNLLKRTKTRSEKAAAASRANGFKSKKLIG